MNAYLYSSKHSCVGNGRGRRERKNSTVVGAYCSQPMGQVGPTTKFATVIQVEKKQKKVNKPCMYYISYFNSGKSLSVGLMWILYPRSGQSSSARNVQNSTAELINISTRSTVLKKNINQKNSRPCAFNFMAGFIWNFVKLPGVDDIQETSIIRGLE